MTYWPFEENRLGGIHGENQTSSFWARIGNFYNAGVDIYAVENELVRAIHNGTVIHTGSFTSNDEKSFLNYSEFVVIKSNNNLHVKYAGIETIDLHVGQKIQAGEIIGKVTNILNSSESGSPRTMNDINLISYFENPRLHLEVYKPPFVEIKPYSYGLFKAHYRPEAIIDPQLMLQHIDEKKVMVS